MKVSDKAKKILKKIYTMVRLALIIVFVLSIPYYVTWFAVSGINPYDYTGWQLDYVVPTDTCVRATMALPQKWEFDTENGWVKIIDTQTGNLVGEQIYSCKRYTYGGDTHTSYNFNETARISIQSKENFQFVAYDNGATLYKYIYENGEYTCLDVNIGEYAYDGDGNSYEYVYLDAGFIFYEQKEDSFFEQILFSVYRGDTYYTYEEFIPSD